METTLEVTEVVEATPTVEATATVEPTVAATPTGEIEATAEVTSTAEITGTDAMTDTAGASASFLVRASTLLAMELSDEVDETAGELQDILFAEDGTLHCAILDLDGEAGTETVAVPWEQLNLQNVSGTEIDDPDYGLTWADGRDAAVTTTIESNAWAEDSITVDAVGLGLELDAAATVTTTNLFRASAFVDQGLFDSAEGDLVTADGENVGEIEDLLIDADAGQIVYVVAEAGSFLLVDQRAAVLPWQRVTFDATTEQFSTDADQATLEEAPEFDLDGAFADSEIRMDDALRSELDTYWGVDIDGDLND